MHIVLDASEIRNMQSSFSTHVKKRESMLDSFAKVGSKTRNASGGVGNMQSSLSALENRIRKERTKVEQENSVKSKVNEFVELAGRVDSDVASKLDKNKNEFYKKYPHLKPPKSKDEKNALERVWDWICGGVEKAIDLGRAIQEKIKGWAKDLIRGIKNFYLEHKDLIDTIVKIVLTVVIVVGAVVGIVATWGTGLAVLAPILTAIGLSASTAAAVSTAVVVATLVSTALAAVMDVVDLWFEIDHPVFNFFQVTFNIISIVGNLTVGIGKAFNQAYKIDVSKGFKIREVAKTDMKAAMEMSVENGTTNSWYMQNLAESSKMNIGFDASADIDFGYKFGTHKKWRKSDYIVKWHSQDRFALRTYGPNGGGSGWTAQLSVKPTPGSKTFDYLSNIGTWLPKPDDITHIRMPDLPTIGKFNVIKWAWDNKGAIWKSWTNPFK